MGVLVAVADALLVIGAVRARLHRVLARGVAVAAAAATANVARSVPVAPAAPVLYITLYNMGRRVVATSRALAEVGVDFVMAVRARLRRVVAALVAKAAAVRVQGTGRRVDVRAGAR